MGRKHKMEPSKKTKKESKKEAKKENKKKKKSKILTKILMLLLIALISAIAVIAYRTQKNGGGIQGLLSTLVGHNEETLKNLSPIQVLLMGVSTDNGGKLTDTIIVGTYDPKQQIGTLLSIPRDTFVGKDPQTGTSGDKLNALYQKSPERTLQKVNEITGLDIKYYMVIDNQALIKLVDVIGGVEFDVPYVPGGMVYDDPSQDLHINLQSGLQVLDGDKAEQLLRYRHGNLDKKTRRYLGTYPEEYGGNDYGRMRTQREFMIATVKQTIQAKNILKIKDIIDIAYEYVETNLSISVIKDYVPYAINIDVDSIRSEVLPGGSYGPTTTPKYPYWYFIPDKVKTAKLIEELYSSYSQTSEEEETTSNTETPTTSSTTDKDENSSVKIELVNGTSSKDVLAKVKKVLEKNGYKVTSQTETNSTTKTTIINNSDVDEKFTSDIKELLGTGKISTGPVSSNKADITIIIGKDYK